MDIRAVETRLIEHYRALTTLLANWQTAVFAILVVSLAGVMTSPIPILAKAPTPPAPVRNQVSAPSAGAPPVSPSNSKQPVGDQAEGHMRLLLMLVGGGVVLSLTSSLYLYLYTRTVHCLREDSKYWREAREQYCGIPSGDEAADQEIRLYTDAHSHELWRPPWMIRGAFPMVLIAVAALVIALAAGGSFPQPVRPAALIAVCGSGILDLTLTTLSVLTLYYQVQITHVD